MTLAKRDDIVEWLQEMANIFDQRVKDLLSPRASLELGKVQEELRHAEAISARCHGAIVELNKTTWQPIETAPKDRALVVLVLTDKGVRIVKRSQFTGDWLTVPGDWTCRPTHWQPLPAPPEAA